MESASNISQFVHFPLFMVSLGLLLTAMAPHSGSALECYVGDIPDQHSLGGEGTALGNKELMNLPTQIGMPSSSNAEPTEQCPYPGIYVHKYCLTYHCTLTHGNKTVKRCEPLRFVEDPVEICQRARDACARDDAKFYCRFCNTNKCNNETL